MMRMAKVDIQRRKTFLENAQLFDITSLINSNIRVGGIGALR